MGLPRRCPADIFTLLADIDDVLQYVADTREANPALEDLPRFLIVRGFGVVRDCGYATAPSRVTSAMNACLQGHSMGGAIAYLTSRRSEDVWTGVVFSGPGGCLATAGVRPEFARLTVHCVWCCSHKAGPCCCDTSEANRRQSVGLLAAKGATRGNAGACSLVAVSRAWLCLTAPHRSCKWTNSVWTRSVVTPRLFRTIRPTLSCTTVACKCGGACPSCALSTTSRAVRARWHGGFAL